MTISDDPTTEVIDALASRSDLIDALSAEPKDKREIVDELGVSRSTVDRGVRELEVLGLVDYASGGLTLTFAGRLLAQEYRGFEERVASVLDAQSVITVLGRESDLDARLLAGAEIVPADSIAPFKPGEKMVEVVRKAERLRMTSRAHTYPETEHVFHNQIVNEEMSTEIVFRARMLDYLRANLRESLHDILSKDNCNGYVADTIPFGLYLTERDNTANVCVLVYGPDNQYTGFISNDTEDAIQWGEETYQRYRQRAERIDA
jgi:predicted transcriptional regulator